MLEECSSFLDHKIAFHLQLKINLDYLQRRIESKKASSKNFSTWYHGSPTLRLQPSFYDRVVHLPATGITLPCSLPTILCIFGFVTTMMLFVCNFLVFCRSTVSWLSGSQSLILVYCLVRDSQLWFVVLDTTRLVLNGDNFQFLLFVVFWF